MGINVFTMRNAWDVDKNHKNTLWRANRSMLGFVFYVAVRMGALDCAIRSQPSPTA